jgi:hypothetical protein
VIGWSAVHSWAPLPALYILLLAAGGAAVLRRWFDPVPRRVLLLFLVYVALLLAPGAGGRGATPQFRLAGAGSRKESSRCPAPT